MFSIIFFPYVSLLGLSLPNDSGSLQVATGYTLFFVQYPVYGVILWPALKSGKFYRRLLTLLLLHFIVAGACLALYYHSGPG